MANTGSQAQAIRDLLIERLEQFDPTLETAEGSPLYAQVIQPLFEALGTDPFDTDIKVFLTDRLRQEYPSIAAVDGEAIVDLLIKPLSTLLEPLKRELQILRRGQSTRNASTMRLEDAEGLAGNFFTTRNVGDRNVLTVRVFYEAPTFVNVLSTVTFSTQTGLRFFPIRPQFFRPEQVLLQRSGNLFYVDVQVIAEEAGDAYNVGIGEVTRVTGLSNVSRVTNLSEADNGVNEETASELLQRTSTSLTERSLNTRRGISARLRSDFPSVQSVEVVGRGDPEMNRDILTGGGHGKVISSGICIIVGNFCLMFSQYEDRGYDGSGRVRAGDEIDLNYWNFLYGVDPADAHESFLIDSVVFDTRDLFEEDLPSVVLFQLSGTPTADPPVAATLPGVLPGVFAVVKTRGTIEISGIPGGILNPDTPRGTILIEDNEVHVGGMYDVWVRPKTDVGATVDPGVARSASALLEERDLFTAGNSLRFKNLVHRRYVIEFSVLTGSLQLGEPIDGAASSATAVILEKTPTHIVLGEFGIDEFEVGETITGRFTGAKASVVSVQKEDWASFGVSAGMALSIASGNDRGTYKILQVHGPLLYLDADLTVTEENLLFRVLSEVTMSLFSPREQLLPFGSDLAEDLSTVIGSNTVKTSLDMLQFGVETGDSLEILEGNDQGVYTITGFDSSLGGRGATLSSTMTSSSSNLAYRVFRPGSPLQTPLVRIQPGGVKLLDPTGQDSGNVLPYALPVEGRALEAFSGAGQSAFGRNGFVLPDPGKNFEPTGDMVCDPEVFSEAKACFSDECLQCDNGYIACATLTEDGTFYLDVALPAAAKTFLTDLRQWFLDVISAFELGDDVQAFVDGFHPFVLGPPVETSVVPILKQFEICIPAEIFDGCENVFVGIPEFDWQSEFEEQGPPFDVGTVTFSEALDKFNSGELEGAERPPALLSARSGDSLTILSGGNAGGYVIDRVFKYKLCHGGAIQDEGGDAVVDMDKCYDVAVVTIRGRFPVSPLSGLVEFFQDGVAPLTVPLPPTLNVQSMDLTTGDPVDTWDIIQELLTWLFQWLNSMGFDLPDGVTLNPGEVLKAVWQLLFTEYLVGQPTCEQNIRLTFIEPTSFTAYGNQACVAFEYNEPEGTPASVVGANITVPLPGLEGVDGSVVLVDALGTTTLTATLSAAAAAATTLQALAAELQSLFDATASFVVFSGPSTPTGALTISSVKGGESVSISVVADQHTDAFRALGFYDQDGKKWAFMYHSEIPTDTGRDVVLPTAGSIGFTWQATLGGAGSGDILFSAGTYTWQEILDTIVAQLTVFLDATLAGGSISDLSSSSVAGSYQFGLELVANIVGGSDTWDVGTPIAVVAGGTGTDYSALLVGGFLVAGVTTSSQIVQFQNVIDVGGLSISVTPSGNSFLRTWADFADFSASGIPDALQHIIDNPASTSRYDLLAQALNSYPTLTKNSGELKMQFVGGDRIEIRALEDGGSAVAMTVNITQNGQFGGFRLLLFLNDPSVLSDVAIAGSATQLVVLGTNVENFEGQGAVEPGELIRALFEPPEATLFSAVTGAAELLFAASGAVDSYQVYPGENSGGRIPVTELPRDIVVAADYDGATANLVRFSDGTQAAPVAAGVQPSSDLLWLYEQRVPLEPTIFLTPPQATKDRVIAVITSFGSNIVTLPRAEEPDFNFLDSTSSDSVDEVDVGDIIMVEEGEDAGGFIVVRRSETVLELDRVMSESSGKVYKSGNDGILEAGGAVFRSVTAQFTDDDVGRFLTIWAQNRENYDGSYRILSVTDLGSETQCELDTDTFDYTEQEIHWAVVRAPTEDPGPSAIGGRTELVGVRPIRIYRGTPSEFRVARVSPHLDRTLSEVLVVHAEGAAPREGVKQPYQFVRHGVQHISSTGMKAQGRELGLYYFDVLSQSLGGDAIHNLPEGARMEPIFGTYDSDGYRLEVDDPNLVYSSSEVTTLVMSPQVLPTGFNDTVSNKVLLNGTQLRISYDYAPVVDQVQRLLSSEADRILTASPLARHYLPSYVYLDVVISGGNSTSKIAQDLISSIEGLSPTDALDVSQLEKILHQNSVVRYDHPVTALIVTHDLDRRLVGFRSVNKIDEDEIAFNGTNRITFFIPGPDESGKSSESDIPDGERIYLSRGLSSSTF